MHGVSEDAVSNMRHRAEQCRFLAKSINDERAASILLQMAEEIETDIGQMADQCDKEGGSSL